MIRMLSDAIVPFKLDFPPLTKAQIVKIAKYVAPQIDMCVTSGKTPISFDDETQYISPTYSVFKETPILNFLPFNIAEKKVLKGSKSLYSLNLLTLRPTLNSKLKYDISVKSKERIGKIIEAARQPLVPHHPCSGSWDEPINKTKTKKNID